jgi:uncharacterized protein
MHKSLSAALVLLTLGLCGCGVERSLVFHPSPFPDGRWEPCDLGHEEATFESGDGTRLHGWFAEAANPRAVVLYAHGNAGNLTSRAWVLRLFRDRLKCSVLVFDYRGYGKSDGEPDEAGVLADARAARRWLASRTGVAEKDIVLVGASLGGAVAVDLAAEDGARGLVLENTFTSLPDVAAEHLPLVPVRWLMRTRLDSLSKIARYQGPLLQTHGGADRVVPFALGKQLFDAANEPKRFVAVADGGHNDPPAREYVEALEEFILGLP